MTRPTHRRRPDTRVLAVAAVLALASTCGVVGAEVTGRPEIGVAAADNRLVAGENTTLRLSVTNAGRLDELSTTTPGLNERVLTAKGLTVDVDDRGVPLSVETGPRRVGSLADGQGTSLPFRVSVDEDARPGRYRVDVDVEYTHTSRINQATGDTRTLRIERTVEVPVVVERRARFRVVGVAGSVGPARTGPVSVTVVNSGSETASGTVLELASLTDGVTVESSPSASRYVGAWRPGARRTVTYSVRADATVTSADYPFDLTARFRDARNRSRRGDALRVGVEPRRTRQFAVTGVTSNLSAGGEGTLVVSLRNTGAPAREAVLSAAFSGGAFDVDGVPASNRFVGRWPSGTERTFAFDVAPGSSVSEGVYTLDVAVSYRTEEGFDVTARPEPLGVRVAPEVTFRLGGVDADLTVGEAGTLSGTLTSRGPGVARDVVVVADSASPNVAFEERTFAAGRLDPGESVAFAFDAAVGPSAEPGPRPFNVTVRYRTAAGTRRTSDPLPGRQRVAPQRDWLLFRATNASLGIDTSNRLPVEVTNVGDEPLRDVSVALTPRPPLSSESPTAFVDRLDPGESTVVAFELTVSEDAVASTQGVGVNATAETLDDDPIRTDTRLLALQTVEPGGPGSDAVVVGLGAVLVTVLFVAGWWWLRR